MSARRRIGEGVGKEMVHDGVGFRGGEFCLALPCSSKRQPFTLRVHWGVRNLQSQLPPYAENHRLHRGRLLIYKISSI